ncbi:MAG: hypothetical protein N2515_01000, partial [Deltaproteobacteria bacterium]|nr:hypothetical protein [Deltaproteobacteria bacterium]
SRPRMPPCSYSPSLASSRATFEPATWLKVAASLAPAALAFVVPGTLLETNHLKARLTYRLPWSLAPREILRFEKP